MKELLNNYKKVKGLMVFAKQTFLSEKGMEIIPTLENLEDFVKHLNSIVHLIDELIDDIHKKSEN